MTFEDLIVSAKKLGEMMPPRYRVHAIEGITQFIAFDGKLFVTQDAARQLFAKSLAAESRSIAAHVFSMQLLIREQHQLDHAAFLIRYGSTSLAEEILK